MAPAPIREPVTASDDERKDIGSLLRALESLHAPDVHLTGADGTTMLLPEPLYRVLVEAARQLATGNAVSLMPYTQELTTQQAADLLNVSRPHLVSLLESGAMLFHKVGTHRRVQLSDLLAYKHARDASRREALQSMVDEAQTLGIYEEDLNPKSAAG